MSRAREVRAKTRARAAATQVANPAALRQVICGYCGDPTGETAVDPVGTCRGCRALIDSGMAPDGSSALPPGEDRDPEDDLGPIEVEDDDVDEEEL